MTQHLRILARFAGPSGEIAVMEDTRTGERLYEEGGVSQSSVLAGGEAGVEYIRLMAALLEGAPSALLLGCGGGALATMLQRRGSRVTVVDVNPMSFELARTFFWMPNGIECVTADMRAYLRRQARSWDAIGIDVGGPCFSYDEVLQPATIARVRRALRAGGRVAVNISCEVPDDPMPGRIAERLRAVGLDVWVFMEESDSVELNAVVLASARREKPSALARAAGKSWSVARLAGPPNKIGVARGLGSAPGVRRD
jgi:spermidine synthase